MIILNLLRFTQIKVKCVLSKDMPITQNMSLTSIMDMLYQHTKKFWLVTFYWSNRLIEFKIHQNQYFILLFQSNGQILNLTMAQVGCVSYLPIMKFQSLKISNTLLIKRVIHYISITKNWENDLQNTTKNLQNDIEWICIWHLILPF